MCGCYQNMKLLTNFFCCASEWIYVVNGDLNRFSVENMTYSKTLYSESHMQPYFLLTTHNPWKSLIYSSMIGLARYFFSKTCQNYNYTQFFFNHTPIGMSGLLPVLSDFFLSWLFFRATNF